MPAHRFLHPSVMWCASTQRGGSNCTAGSCSVRDLRGYQALSALGEIRWLRFPAQCLSAALEPVPRRSVRLFKKSSSCSTTDIVHLEHLERNQHFGPGEPSTCQCREFGEGEEGSGALEVIQAGARCLEQLTAVRDYCFVGLLFCVAPLHSGPPASFERGAFEDRRSCSRRFHTHQKGNFFFWQVFVHGAGAQALLTDSVWGRLTCSFGSSSLSEQSIRKKAKALADSMCLLSNLWRCRLCFVVGDRVFSRTPLSHCFIGWGWRNVACVHVQQVSRKFS